MFLRYCLQQGLHVVGATALRKAKRQGCWGPGDCCLASVAVHVQRLRLNRSLERGALESCLEPMPMSLQERGPTFPE